MDNCLTWSELYTFLDSMSATATAEEWNSRVLIHNVETDDEYVADVLYINSYEREDEERLVLAINYETLDEQ